MHGGIDHETRVNIQWIESEDIERQGTERILREVDGILIPGGFGAVGSKERLPTIRYAREHQIPFLGLCLGMQCADDRICAECRGTDRRQQRRVRRALASSRHPSDVGSAVASATKGGPCGSGPMSASWARGRLAQKMYGVSEVRERHRHRYEFNNAYRERLDCQGTRAEWVFRRTAGWSRSSS